MAQHNFTRSSPWRAMWPLLFNRDQYLRIAAEHEIAISLQSADYRASYEKGEYPRADWESPAIKRAQLHRQDLFRGLRQSLMLTLAFAVLGTVIVMALGKVDPSLPFAAGKFLSVVGALLAAWATLFELGGYVHTYDGEALHELLHPVFFKLIFLPGLAIATVGQLW